MLRQNNQQSGVQAADPTADLEMRLKILEEIKSRLSTLKPNKPGEAYALVDRDFTVQNNMPDIPEIVLTLNNVAGEDIHKKQERVNATLISLFNANNMPLLSELTHMSGNKIGCVFSYAYPQFRNGSQDIIPLIDREIAHVENQILLENKLREPKELKGKILNDELERLRLLIKAGYAGDELTDSYYASIKKTEVDINKKMEDLENAIDALKKHADQMPLEDASKAEKLIALHAKLSAATADFRQLPTREKQPQSFSAFARKIDGLLKESKPDLEQKRVNVKTILKNIVAALTGVGALILGFQAAASGLYRGSPQFFFSKEKTTSQERAHSVDEALKNIQPEVNRKTR